MLAPMFRLTGPLDQSLAYGEFLCTLTLKRTAESTGCLLVTSLALLLNGIHSSLSSKIPLLARYAPQHWCQVSDDRLAPLFPRAGSALHFCTISGLSCFSQRCKVEYFQGLGSAR